MAVRALVQLREAIASFVDGFDASVLSPAEAQAVVQETAAIRNIAATLQALAAPRVADTNLWAIQGHRSPAEWLAARAGTGQGAARVAIDTARRLEALPATSAAVRSGELSADQAALVAAAAACDPSAERRLLNKAAEASLPELRDECARVRAAADPDPDATHERARQERRLRFFPDAEGGVNLQARTTPDQMAPIRAAVDGLVDDLFARARREGRREPREAYAMDALAEICRSHLAGGDDRATPAHDQAVPRRRPRGPRYLGIIRADLTALRRGRAEDDEVCEIAGLGPVPVRVARSLLGDAALHLVLTRGVEVANVTSLARRPSVAMRMAVLWTSPGCTVTGCASPRIEFDHRVDWAHTRRTRLPDLDGLCRHHHDLKTHGGWALVPGVGKRTMVPPEDQRHPTHRPPGMVDSRGSPP